MSAVELCDPAPMPLGMEVSGGLHYRQGHASLWKSRNRATRSLAWSTNSTLDSAAGSVDSSVISAIMVLRRILRSGFCHDRGNSGFNSQRLCCALPEGFSVDIVSSRNRIIPR